MRGYDKYRYGVMPDNDFKYENILHEGLGRLVTLSHH